MTIKIYKKYENLPINIAMKKSIEEKAKRQEAKDMRELKTFLQKNIRNGESGLVTLVVNKQDGHIEILEAHRGDD